MSSLTAKITDRLTQDGTINPEDKELYSYGLHQGFVIIANVLTTIALGLVFGMLWQSIVFMAAYIPLRTFAGGYHARTQLRCYFSSIVLTASILFVIRLVPWTSIINIILICFAAVTISILAPVEDENKPLEPIEVRTYKRRAIKILSTEVCTAFILLVFRQAQIVTCISVSLLALSVMLILGKIKNLKSQSKCEI